MICTRIDCTYILKDFIKKGDMIGIWFKHLQILDHMSIFRKIKEKKRRLFKISTFDKQQLIIEDEKKVFIKA